MKDEQLDTNNILESELDPEKIKAKQEEYREMIVKDNPAELAEKAPSPWKLSTKGKEAVSHGVAMFQTSFGLYAAIPMLCKGEECPYAQLFPEMHDGAVEDGERCPVEVSFIMSKYQQYMKELMIEEEDAVDMSLLRDLIDFDIQILRADNRIAIEGGFTEEQVVAVSEATGEPIYRESVTAVAEYKDKVQNKRNKTLELMNSTRKDKEGSKITHIMDPSSYAAQLLKDFNQTKTVSEIAQFEELEIVEDVPYMQQLERDRAEQEAKKKGMTQLTYEEMYEEREE